MVLQVKYVQVEYMKKQKKEDAASRELNNLLDDIELNNEISNNKIKDNTSIKDNAVDVKVKNTTEEANNNVNKEVVLNNVSNALNTYVTYHIHILNDGEDVNNIINKYKVTKELIDEYNSGLEWVMGEKVIIPDLQDD